MSKENLNLLIDDMTNSVLELSANVKCKIHQTLNKYYLKNKKTFVCEYDGFDDEGPDSFMHMPQILEKYHDEIINLQSHPEFFEHNEVSLKLPTISKNGKKLNIDISKFNYEYDKFMQDTFSKLINFFRASNSLIDVKDLIHEVKFTTDGKPELKKIGMDDQKEQKLLILSQYLVLHNHDSITIENLTEKFLNFLENYQLKMVDLIFNSLDFLDLGYELLLPEIAKLEKKKLGQIDNKDYLKSHITTPKFKEDLIKNYTEIIRFKDKELLELKEKLNNLTNHKNNLENDKNILQLKFDEFKKNSKINDQNSRDRISELQENINELLKENEKHRNERLKNHASDIKKLREYYDSILDRAKLDYQKQIENQHKDFEALLNSFKNQNLELEKHQKDISNPANLKNDNNLGNYFTEIEDLVNTEKLNNQLENEKSLEKINQINLDYFNISKENENLKKKILENETNGNNLTNKLNELEKENEKLRLLLKEKDDLIQVLNDCHLKEKLDAQSKMDLLSSNFKQTENEFEKFKRDSNRNERYNKYLDMYENAKNEKDKVLFEKEGIQNHNKYLQSQLDSTKNDLDTALKNLKDKKDEYNKNIDKVNNLNNNLKNELNDKNRKLDLIKSQTEHLYEKLKPYPWGINSALNKPIVRNRIEKKNHLDNRGLNIELDSSSNNLNKQNELNNKKIENLSKENEKMKNRIVNLLSHNGNIKIEEETKEMKLPNDEKVHNLQEKIKKKEINEKDFKDLDFINNDLDSLLLLNKANVNQIRNWIYPLKNNFYTEFDLCGSIKFNLLYKASINGFSSDKFFKNCSNLNNLLVVCLTNHGKLIGGFTTLKFIVPDGDEKIYINDNELKSFLFSLTLNRKLPLVKSEFAILCSKNLGPVFGGGSDFEIVNNADKNMNNFGEIGHSYDDGYKITPKEFYGGDKYLVQDYEVYQLNL
jgi:hypothetical protein